MQRCFLLLFLFAARTAIAALLLAAVACKGIDDDEDSICDAFGVDAYHRIRDAQGTFALYP